MIEDRARVHEGGLSEFVKLSWPLIEASKLHWNWHIGAICEHMQAVIDGEINNLVINVPPGSSKSTTVSVLAPAYSWAIKPYFRWIAASYSSQLSTRDARRMRDVVSSEWFRERWPKGHATDLQRILRFMNNSGGERLSTSVGSVATGFHGHGHICDDPLKPADVQEARTTSLRAKLESVLEWWNTTMSSRAVDLATLRRVIIMQRLHELDLAGQMIERGYEPLILPMEYNPKIQIEADPRTEPGELLDPVRFPRDAVERLKEDLGPEGAAAQLDQSPVPPGGGLFKEEYFAKRWTYDSLPNDLILIQSWDLRFKDDAERGSFVVGQVWGYQAQSPDMYLLEQVRGRWSYAETREKFREVCRRWPRCTVKLVENKANGPALKSDLEQDVGGIELADPLGDKTQRANVAEPHWRSGRVWIPAEESWVEEFVREHMRFPRYKTDDQVDAASQAIAYMHVEGNQIGDYLAGIRAARR